VKDAAAEIVGRRISGVVVRRARRGKGPMGQLFLVFEDGFYFEFYAPESQNMAAGGLDKGGLVRALRYTPDSHVVEWAAVRDPDSGEVSVDSYSVDR
jgi:hypothetical protein